MSVETAMSSTETTQPPIVVRRSYLLAPEGLKEFTRKYAENLVRIEREWTETYLDTKGSNLSHCECILMRDSTSPKYWKFFCYAHDNIHEITTDEREIREPLSRLLELDSVDCITEDLLRPFFHIKCFTRNYLIQGCQVRLTATDYDFAYCVLERYCLPSQSLIEVIEEISTLAESLGMKSLAGYEAKRYL